LPAKIHTYKLTSRPKISQDKNRAKIPQGFREISQLRARWRNKWHIATDEVRWKLQITPPVVISGRITLSRSAQSELTKAKVISPSIGEQENSGEMLLTPKYPLFQFSSHLFNQPYSHVFTCSKG
jgi:hypothetical protein